jgi:hypothetical protein
MSRTRKLIVLGVVVVIIGMFLYFTPTISTFQNYLSQSSYTKVTIVQGQFAHYDHGDNHYSFAWKLGLMPNDSPTIFAVFSGFQSESFSTTPLGATYTAFGLEIKVSEVYTDHIVLLVKPE